MQEVKTDHYRQTVYVCKQKRLLLADILFKEMREWRIGLNGVKCGAVERGGGNVTKTI